MNLTIDNLEQCFYEAKRQNRKYVAVLIEMKDFNKPDVIINENDNFDNKLAYYKKSYNQDLTLKAFNGIKIIGFTYGDSFMQLEYDLIN